MKNIRRAWLRAQVSSDPDWPRLWETPPPTKEAQNLAARSPNCHTLSHGGQTAVPSRPVDVGDADVAVGGGYDNDSDVFLRTVRAFGVCSVPSVLLSSSRPCADGSGTVELFVWSAPCHACARRISAY